MRVKMCFLSFIFFISCLNEKANSEKIKTTEESISIHYMRPYVQTISYNCEMINKEALGEDINYKTFSDSITISKFLNIYKKYEIEPDQDDNINARIRVVINTSKIKDTLCLGEGFNTFINGVKYKDNKEMYLFITKLIDYENTPRPKKPWDNKK